jgi:hypothetical protein
MKKTLATIAAVIFAITISVQAEETKDKPKLTKEQKGLRKEIAGKYDTNKDGKLDKEERAKISQEDKDRMEKAGVGKKKERKK